MDHTSEKSAFGSPAQEARYAVRRINARAGAGSGRPYLTIYLDSSVALAELLSEDRRISPNIWNQELTSSRLLEYEVWNRLHARGLARSHAQELTELLNKIDLMELSPIVLQRALDFFPIPVRTLDALHLATIEYLRAEG